MTTPPVRKTVTVQAAPATAFRVFTEGMSRWWNPGHTIGAEPFEALVIEPHEGGRWYERGASGATCEWGRVLTWDPPHRLLLAWELSADWRHDPDLATEVEVRFTATGPSTTRVELEHRNLDVLGAHAEAAHRRFDDPGGWQELLERFAASEDFSDAAPAR
jgi:uncharacterized protein YndB with AHSA1/START domain